jgi:diguanylate cyclase (GGDEF)-like protein
MAQFSHGSRELRVTASVGVAQWVAGEEGHATRGRAEQALAAAKRAGRNCTWWHDGRETYPVHAIHAPADASGPAAQGPDLKLIPAGSWRLAAGAERVELSGRSVFVSNVKRRLGEWHRGGEKVSVILLRVDQYAMLVERFGAHAQGFMRGVMGKLLEAASRDMDERCEFDDQTFAVLLPGADNETAVHVAERLRSQVSECKIRINKELWELSASIGVACCMEGDGAMEILKRAAIAIGAADRLGGNAIYLGDPAYDEPQRMSGWM